MNFYLAKVRVSGFELIEVEVIASSPSEAKEQLENEFGEGNVVYYPRLIF
jgi:hypothetical protein